jgi:hypothetical protein
MIVVAAVLTGLTLAVGTFIAIMHWFNYTNPRQQRQLARAVVVPAVFSIFSFFSIWFYDDVGYLIPCADLYECFALVGIFYYIINAVTPDESKRLLFFQGLENKDKDGSVIPGGSLEWLYVRSFIASMSLLDLTAFRNAGCSSSSCFPAAS